MSTTAFEITAGTWVRFPSWERWRWVAEARHTVFRPNEPRASGFVTYDAADRAGGRFTFGGFALHDQPCHVVRITPRAVA